MRERNLWGCSLSLKTCLLVCRECRVDCRADLLIELMLLVLLPHSVSRLMMRLLLRRLLLLRLMLVMLLNGRISWMLDRGGTWLLRATACTHSCQCLIRIDHLQVVGDSPVRFANRNPLLLLQPSLQDRTGGYRA